MNFAQMLMTGPTIKSVPPVVKKREYKKRDAVTFRSIDRYKKHSDGNLIYSILIANRLGINIHTASKQLKVYLDAGLLEVVGKADCDCKSMNKPVLYRWIK